MNTQLSQVAERYIQTINNHDASAFITLFADDALVNDVGREFRGLNAIQEWSDREIFAVQVMLDVMDHENRDGESVITASVDGTFDRTGLPDPLIIVHHIVAKGDKIAELRCRFADEVLTA